MYVYMCVHRSIYMCMYIKIQSIIVWVPQFTGLQQCPKFFFFIEVQLTNNILLVSGIQHNDLISVYTSDHWTWASEGGVTTWANHGWPLKNMGFNCVNPLIYRFLFPTVNTMVPHDLWLVESNGFGALNTKEL